MFSAPGWLRLTLGLALGACYVLRAPPSLAQVPVSAPHEAEDPGEAGARKHFDRSLELYRAGHYQGALNELEEAAKLDPDGKDLFFNLALVHEKLGQLPEAIAALERFRELEIDAAERERARLTIERLRGAEASAPNTAVAPSQPCPERATASPAAAVKTANPVLIGTASLAVVSLVVGVVFGAKALSEDVSNEGTSASFSVTQLHERGRRAQRDAIVADVAFALSAASAGTFAGVWMLAPSDSGKRAAGITLRSYF